MSDDATNHGEVPQLPETREMEEVPTPVIPDHEILGVIGRGGFGKVFLARNIMGTYRAVKVVYRHHFLGQTKPYQREYRGIEQFEPISRTHDGLVDVLQIGQAEDESYFYYVMELSDDRTTGQAIDPDRYEVRTLLDTVNLGQPLPISNCIELGLKLTSAMGHLHRHGLVHRDIKPSNIIFVNGIPKLADIGLVIHVGEETLPIGTPGYMAPEGKPSPQADIYSLGKVLYELSTGKSRHDYPEMPTEDQVENGAQLGEFMAIVDRACQAEPRRRYAGAEDLEEKLTMLRAGRSVRRWHDMEQRLALLKKVGLALLAVLALFLVILYRNYVNQQEATRRLAAAYVASGTRAINQNDLFGSLSLFAEALRLEEPDPRRANRYRVHLGLALRSCPRILGMWFEGDDLNDVQFSPDGRYLAVASDDSVVIVYDTRDGTEHCRFVGHENGVAAVDYSRSGRFLATGSWDGTARVWNADTGEELRVIPHPGTVNTAEFDRSEGRLVTACDDGLVRIHSLDSTNVVVLQHHQGGVRHATFSPDEHYLLSSSIDCTAALVEVSTGNVIRRIRHQESIGWVYDGAFSEDGRYLATASFDNSVQLLDLETGVTHSLPHDQGVASVEFSPDGRYLVSACWDYSARIWDVRTGREALPPLKHNSYLMHASFAPDGHRIATVSVQGVACIWDISPYGWQPPSIQSRWIDPEAPLQGSPDLQAYSIFSPGGDRYAVIHPLEVQIWKVGPEASQIVGSFPQPEQRILDLKFSGNNESLLAIAAGPDGSGWFARLRQVPSGEPLADAFPCDSSVTNGLLNADGRFLITTNLEAFTIWDVRRGVPLVQERLGNWIHTAAFAPTTDMVCVATSTEVWLRSGPSFAEVTRLPFSNDVRHASFSADGKLLAICLEPLAFDAGTAYVWSLEESAVVGKPLKHGDGVCFASFSPDGRLIATASQDKTAQLWRVDNGERVGLPMLHNHEVYSVAFSPDDRFVVTASRDRTIRVWLTSSSEPYTPPLMHSWGSLQRAQFAAQNDVIISTRVTGERKIWRLVQTTHNREDLALLAQLLSGSSSAPSGATFPLSKQELRQAWSSLSARYKQEFDASPEDMFAWHEREMEACWRDRLWPAAVFHLDQMILLKPEASVWPRWRDIARKHWEKHSDG